jgi:gluconolactonase
MVFLYSDTKLNKIFKWNEGEGRTLYTDKSGCNINKEYCDMMSEPGSNGLLKINSALIPTAEPKIINLLVCQHGERAISLIRENGSRTLMATHYKGRRFNSPNDLIWSPEGNLYSTDPGYGLTAKNGSQIGREMKFNGVYMIRKVATENVILLDSNMSMPNGLAFAPDYSILYVSNSDSKDKYWKVSDVSPNTGALSNGCIFFDANELYEIEKEKVIIKENYGYPDDLKVNINGNIFASGPGGVLVFSPPAELDLINLFRMWRRW